MATIESVCEDLQSVAERYHFAIYVTKSGYNMPVIKVCALTKPDDALLVLSFEQRLILERHRDSSLTSIHKGKTVDPTWVHGFLAANSREEYGVQAPYSNDIPTPEWSWAGDWQD